MKNNRGFIELITLSDYWKKVLFDYEELKSDNENIYKAFNFFVTAYHLRDWIFEGNKTKERNELDKDPIVKLCSHIANGIKHFKTYDSYTSVKEIQKERYVEEGYWEKGYTESPIVIYLNDEELIERFGESVNISILANAVMEFWENDLSNRNMI